MLVLSRRQGEEIVLPVKIRITVLGTKGTTVRLGITAPPEVSIHRKEVWARLAPAMDAVNMIDSELPAARADTVRPE